MTRQRPHRPVGKLNEVRRATRQFGGELATMAILVALALLCVS